MAISLDLSPDQEQRLRSRAETLGLSAEDLAKVAVEDLLQAPDEEFRRAADYVVQKNRELYKRLS